VVLLLTLIMNVLNNSCILLMIMCGGVKITDFKESADFATLDTEKLFSKLKSHELSRKCHPNHDAFFTSKALITSAHVGGHDANPTNHLLWRLFCLLLLQLLMSNMRAFLTTRLPCLEGNFGQCTSFRMRGEETSETPEASLSVAAPPTSSPTAPREKSMTIPTRTTTTIRTTTRIRIASEARRRRTSRRSYPENVQP
jgi:hypothetical protein